MSDDKKLYLDGHEIKVGDRLYHLVDGWGVVVSMGYNIGLGRYFILRRGDTQITAYCQSPNFDEQRYRVLYWDEVKIIPPPKPPKKEVRYQWLMWAGHTHYVTCGKHIDADEAQMASGDIPIRPIEETRQEYQEYEVPE